MTATARLIVEVRGGRSGATKTVLEPGSTVRFGRTTLADVTIPHDETLSGVHFELAWDGERALVRDRNSHAGTFVDGLPVRRGQVSHGGWIRAGRTDFVVYVEATIAAAPPDPHAPGEVDAERRAAAERALAELRALASSEPLYAILDTARDDRILAILRQSVERHHSLYDGVEGETLAEVAPYLVGPMLADSMLLDRLVLEGWGKRWGIWVKSPTPFREIRRHFRRFLMIELEEPGERVYFRFYDPRVMAGLAKVWSGAQRARVLDGLSGIIIERPDEGGALHLSAGEE